MNKKGFTLIELLAVTIILSLIIVVVSTNGFGAFNNAKVAINEQNLKTIKESANFLMTEVKYCDDEFDMQLVKYFVGDDKDCDDLREKAKTSECLEITLKYLWENKYVTNSGIEEIYENNPNFTLKGCLIDDKIIIEDKE